MITYEELKKQIKDHNTQLLTGVCFVLVFFVGFGTGKFSGGASAPYNKNQSNYTTKSFPSKAAPQVKAAETTSLTATTSLPSSSCLIKGNISTGGKKIYHVPTGALYKVVKPEQCFNTEAEALAAGFVKSGR